MNTRRQDTETIARIMTSDRKDETAAMTEPYEDERPEEIERRHAEKIAQTKRIEEEYRKAIADNRKFLLVSWTASRLAVEEIKIDDRLATQHLLQDGTRISLADNGGYVVTPTYAIICVAENANAPVNVEKLRAEVHALHSELGDASQTVFDVLERLREKEAEAHTLRVKVDTLESRVITLKQQYERLKAQIGPML